MTHPLVSLENDRESHSLGGVADFHGGQHVPLYPLWLINIVTSNIVYYIYNYN